MKLYVLPTILLGWCCNSWCEDVSAAEKFVSSITSIAQVKNVVRNALNAGCATGSCVGNNARLICSAVGALDVQTQGVIFDASKPLSASPIRVSPADLKLMKSIWSQCRPTTDQYWNRMDVLAVAYDPDRNTDAMIRAALNVTAPNRETPEVNTNQKPVTIPSGANGIKGSPVQERAFEALYYRTQECMRQAVIALLRDGLDLKDALIAKSTQLCATNLANFLQSDLGRPQKEVSALIYGMASQAVAANGSKLPLR